MRVKKIRIVTAGPISCRKILEKLKDMNVCMYNFTYDIYTEVYDIGSYMSAEQAKEMFNYIQENAHGIMIKGEA